MAKQLQGLFVKIMNYIVYFILIFLTTYTDSFLTPYLGAFGFSLLPTLSYLLFFIRFVLGKRKRYKHPFPVFFSRIINYSFGLSIIVYIVFLSLKMETTYYGEDLFFKAIRLYVTYMGYVLFLYVMVDIIRDMRTEDIFKPFFFVNVFLAVFGVLEYNQLPHAFISLHNYGFSDTYYRVRLLTQESSHTAPLIEIFFLMSAFYSLFIKKSKFFFYITLACLLVQISITSSKLFMVVLGVSLVYGMWETLKASKHKFLIMIGAFTMLLLFYQYIYVVLEEAFQGDINDSTSTATRSTSNISGYLMGLTIPCGVGFGGYLYFLPKYILFVTEKLSSNLDTSEIMYMIHSRNDKSLAAQSFFAQSSTYWGCIGVVLFVRQLLRLFRNFLSSVNPKHKALFKTAFCVILVNLSIAMGLEFIYLAVFAIAIHITKLKINI